MFAAGLIETEFDQEDGYQFHHSPRQYLRLRGHIIANLSRRNVFRMTPWKPVGRSRPQPDAVVAGWSVGRPAANCIVCGGLSRAAHRYQRTVIGKVVRETTS